MIKGIEFSKNNLIQPDIQCTTLESNFGCVGAMRSIAVFDSGSNYSDDSFPDLYELASTIADQFHIKEVINIGCQMSHRFVSA